MISKKRFTTIDELQAIQRIAVKCPQDVAFQNLESTVIIDAKSYIGMYTLDFRNPVLLVSEDEEFHRQIAGIGENIE